MEVTSWYSQIEKPIREFVKVLRDNGINTTCSCGHKMYIEADVIPDGQLGRIYRILSNYLAENNLPLEFSIKIYLEVRKGILFQCYAYILLKEKE